MKKRIAIGGISHETNEFVGGITTLEAFKDNCYFSGVELLEEYKKGYSHLSGVVEGLTRAGYIPVPLLFSTTVPSGIVTEEAVVTLVEELVAELKKVTPVDGVILTLHGAMLAKNIDDCEGYMLKKIREVIGVSCPIIAVLDLHGNISHEMISAADLLIGFRENPHMDAYERGLEAVEQLTRIYNVKKIEKCFIKLPLILSPLTTWTEANPLKLAKKLLAEEIEKNNEILNISVFGGFAYADTKHTSVSVLVQTDNNANLAKQSAIKISQKIWENRQAALYNGIKIQEALSKAVFVDKKPVLLADTGDNIGGGSPGDSTFMLSEIVSGGYKDCLVTICDSEVAKRACEIGEGGIFKGFIGGKKNKFHGKPVYIKGIIDKLTSEKYQIGRDNHFASSIGNDVDMGRCALIKSNDVSIYITEKRTPPGDLEQLYHIGIDPTKFKIIAVKSAVAFRSSYTKLSKEIYDVNTGGVCDCNLKKIQYKNIIRPIYPLDGEKDIKLDFLEDI
jgi:microcystin degradation protein MlrC